MGSQRDMTDWLSLSLPSISVFSNESALCIRSIKFWALSLLYGPNLTSIHDYWKNHSFDYMDLWVAKNWCFQIVVLQKTLESPLDGKEIKPVNPKGNQPWIFIGRTDAKPEAPILWPPGAGGRRRRRGWQRTRRLGVIMNSMDMSWSKLWEIVKDREACGAAAHRVAESEVNEQQPSLGPTLTSIHDYRKNTALTIRPVSAVMSAL